MLPSKPLLLSAYILLAITYTGTSSFAPYPFSPLIKAFPIFVLMTLALHFLRDRIRMLILFALSFSALGDMLLAIEFSNNFIAGLAAFLVAHIFYALIFSQFVNFRVKGPKTGLCILVIAFCLVMAFMVLPQEPALRIAVICYISVITLMCCTAVFSVKETTWLKGHWMAAAGAMVFAVSDSIIAWDAFRSAVPYASVWIMCSYYLAQALIVTGIFNLQEK